RAADETALLDVAGALLYVETSLDDQVARLGLSDDRADRDMHESESRKVLEVVVREAIGNFSDARQSFVAFVETNWDHAELVEIPRLLDEVAGAVRILDLPLPADYLHGVKRYIEVELIGRKRVPNGKQLDTLADALASVEYYLEALREQRPNRDRILEIARLSLEALGYWPVPADEMGQEQAPSPLSDEDESNAAAAIDQWTSTAKQMDSPWRDAEASTPPVIVAGSDEAGDLATAEAGGAAVADMPEVAPAVVSSTGTGIDGFAQSDDIDDEIREVFLEEL